MAENSKVNDNGQVKKVIHSLDQILVEINDMIILKESKKRSTAKAKLYKDKLLQTRSELVHFKPTDDPNLLDEYNSEIERARQFLGLKKGRGVLFFSISLLLILMAAYITLHAFVRNDTSNNAIVANVVMSGNVSGNITDIKASETFVWTTSPLRYTEILFWTLFGLLTWTILSAERWRRGGDDIGMWSLWFFARAILGIFVSMIVILAINLVDLGAAVTNTFIPVVAAFILGYFAERGYEYFELIRDKIFPTNKPPTITFFNTSLDIDNEHETYKSTEKTIMICGYVRIDDDVPPSTMTLTGTLRKDTDNPFSCDRRKRLFL